MASSHTLRSVETGREPEGEQGLLHPARRRISQNPPNHRSVERVVQRGQGWPSALNPPHDPVPREEFEEATADSAGGTIGK